MSEMQKWVLEQFEKASGMKGVTAWPITLNCWHVQTEDGEVYSFRWTTN